MALCLKIVNSYTLPMKSSAHTSLPPWLTIVGRVPFFCCLAIVGLLIALGHNFREVNDLKEIAFDIAFLDFLHKVIPEAMAPFWIKVYKGTGVELTATMIAITLGFLAWKRYWSEIKYLVFATLGILLVIDQVLKPFFNRTRPLPRLVDVDGRSFPSGHAAGGVVFYFYLAFLLVAHFPQYRWQIYLGATLWVGFIGIASMYCRVHWATDILAGYGVGFIWLTLSLFLLKREKPDVYLKSQ
jgi:undecaprenyl-diphosphatase